MFQAVFTALIVGLFVCLLWCVVCPLFVCGLWFYWCTQYYPLTACKGVGLKTSGVFILLDGIEIVFH